ncbi:MAG TPA: cation-translocating P-type ATPase [Alphaproteobacteria bacterium]|nr:cation-translocating P-type ATPase [Alphaproteobacteria bacterium]
MFRKATLTELEIRGMTCASCAAHVTSALRGVPGVEDAAVNLATERATVLHEGLEPRSLVQAVERAGYEASAELDRDRAAAERTADLRTRGRLLFLSAALCLATVVLAMFVPPFPQKAALLALLTLPVWAVVGWEFHRNALAALRTGTATMDTLVSLGSTAAYVLSLYGAFTGGATYFETASAIVTLIYAGRYLEARARVKSSQAMGALLELRPALAHRRGPDGTVQEVPVELVRVGDELVVAPGERIPVDGTVVEGASSVDRSMLTGEAMPVEVHVDSPLEQGTLNGDGALRIHATAVGAGTQLAAIIEIVRRAQGSMPPVQRLADRVAGIFVPSIIAIAIATFAAWFLFGHRTAAEAIVTAVAVLVVACPCALGLATPTAIIAGVGVAARAGVLFKDSAALERAASVTSVLFDKTGTLTRGTPAVVASNSDEALALAASVESASTHPLARAIVAAARERSLPLQPASDVRAVRGSGIRGRVGAREIAVGAAGDGSSGVTRVQVCAGSDVIGTIDLRDQVRPESALAVGRLRKLGVRVALVSGDGEASVREAAAAAGIQQFYARVAPQRKAEIVRDLQARGERVAFAGDGINDAPALALADIGFAMGTGTGVALETAGAALLSNDPRSVPVALEIARATMRTVKQNLFWAFAYNLALVPLAALGIVQPILAAAAMGLSSLFVVGNSLLLTRRSPIGK